MAQELPRNVPFSRQDLLIDDMRTFTNMRWKLFSFDNHGFGIKENNSIRATFFTQFEDSDKYFEELLLHFRLASCQLISKMNWLHSLLCLYGVFSVLTPQVSSSSYYWSSVEQSLPLCFFVLSMLFLASILCSVAECGYMLLKISGWNTRGVWGNIWVL